MTPSMSRGFALFTLISIQAIYLGQLRYGPRRTGRIPQVSGANRRTGYRIVGHNPFGCDSFDASVSARSSFTDLWFCHQA